MYFGHSDFKQTGMNATFGVAPALQNWTRNS